MGVPGTGGERSRMNIWRSSEESHIKEAYPSRGNSSASPEPNSIPNRRTCSSGSAGQRIRFAYERIAKYGNGWFGGGDSPDDYIKALAELDRYMEKYGRSVDEIEVGQQTKFPG